MIKKLKLYLLILVLFCATVSAGIFPENIEEAFETISSKIQFIGFATKGTDHGGNKLTNLVMCSDSDNGRNLNKAGTVTFQREDVKERTETDSCHETQPWVRELYCTGNEKKGYVMHRRWIDCGNNNRCEDGRCVEGIGTTDEGKETTPETDMCEDPDGGINWNKIATTTGYLNGRLVKRTDSCYGNNKRAIEYYCDGKNLKWEKKRCSEGTLCKNGNCIEEGMESGGGEVKAKAPSCDCEAECADYFREKWGIDTPVASASMAAHGWQNFLDTGDGYFDVDGYLSEGEGGGGSGLFQKCLCNIGEEKTKEVKCARGQQGKNNCRVKCTNIGGILIEVSCKDV